MSFDTIVWLHIDIDYLSSTHIIVVTIFIKIKKKKIGYIYIYYTIAVK